MEDWIYPHLYELEDRHWWFRGRRAVIWSILRHADVPASPRLLDAGCGTGRNIREFGVLGPWHGIEPSAAAVEFCHRRGLTKVEQGRLEALPFDDASFDLMLATDVIEHVADDGAALRELRRVAAPGGCLLVTVPAYMWLWSAHDDSHHHLRRYTLRALLARLRAASWRPVFFTYFNSILLGPIAAARLLRRATVHRRGSDYDATPRALNAALALPMRAEAAWIARGGRLPAGVSIGVVARAA